jgi:hypothetical protein
LERASFANTLTGHDDVLVDSAYRGAGNYNYFSAALETLESDRFVAAWIEGATGYSMLRCWRYDVGDGGFMGSWVVLDGYTQNVRRAGTAYISEGGTAQHVAWLVWDYHPNSSTYTINRGRVRNDGTYVVNLDLDYDAAGAAGARGNTASGPPRPQPRILIAYVQGDVDRFEGSSFLPCGSQLRALLYHPDGTPISGPITVDSAGYSQCFSSPSVVWNSYQTRFEIVYQYRNNDEAKVWWRAKYVTPDGLPESTPHTFTDMCATGFKSSSGVRTGPECHRHTLAYDGYSRNGTHRFVMAYYGQRFWYNQSWARVFEREMDVGCSDIVDIALATTQYSYQTFQHELYGEFRNPKLYDTNTGFFDLDPIGDRLCSNGYYHRGDCYFNEAMASVGYYTAVLYGDDSGDPYNPLFLSILDAY